MAIVKMDKFLLLSFHQHKHDLLKEMQKFGDVHFKRLRREDLADYEFLKADFSQEHVAKDESELESVKFAISKIAPHVTKPKGLKGMMQGPPTLTFEEFDKYADSFNYKSVCEKVKLLDENINAIKSDISKLNAENENLKAWTKLDASPKDFDKLSETQAMLGTINKMAADSFRASIEKDFPNVYLEMLGVTKDDMAMLLMVPKDGFDEQFSAIKELGFSRTGLNINDIPVDAIAKNNKKIAELTKTQELANQGIASYVTEFEKLNVVSDFYKTKLERGKASENFLKTDSVVMYEGWVPTEAKATFEDMLKRVCGEFYYFESAAAERDDDETPVKLKNNAFVKAFESVTKMYATPKYNEIDPTPFLAPFYWFFFGFMVGDLGFGLLLMAGTFFAMKFLPLKQGMKDFLKFFFFCSFAVVIAGFVYGSFFGFTFWAPIAYTNKEGVAAFKPILDTQLDIPLMLILSVVIGVIQVVFGLLVRGGVMIRDKDYIGFLFDSVLWIVMLLGGVMWLVGVTGMIPANMANIAKWCFILGIIGLALTQGRKSPTLGGKIGTSLWEVYGITGYIGDLVSYTRIVALGLSGAYIGFSFIQMAGILPAGFPRIVFGTIIVLIGQTLNLGLGLLGAYVHSCRLQYVEFFGKFFEGGGKPFAPLKAKNDYINIK